MIWDKEYETLSYSEIEALQEERLRYIVSYAYENVKYYRNLFDQIKLKPSDIKTLKDLPKIPFTDKKAFRDNYPFGLFAVPLKDIVRIHASSGTTGKSTVVGYTKRDLETWSTLMARIFHAAGVREKDIVQISFGYGMFTGGFGFHYGAEKIGATVIPMSSGNTKKQIQILKDFGATVITSTPSYALYIAEIAKEEGYNIKDSPLKKGLFGAEFWTSQMRDEIEKALGIKAYDNYGLSEIIGPGFSGECEFQDGMHIAADHFIAEIIDPDTGEVLPWGQEGELVITTLTKEALPVLRYRTHDITSIDITPCKCGRKTPRMRKVKGRTDDMLIIRGVNIFPSQIEEALLRVEEVNPQYQIIVDRKGALDEIEVWVEVREELFSDEMKKMRILQKKIEEELYKITGINIGVRLVEPKTIERSIGKAKRIVDKRIL